MFKSVEKEDPEGPVKYYEKLLQQCDEFEHLVDGEARIEFLYRINPLIMQGKLVLGAVHLPKVQGQLKGVFEWMLMRQFDEMPDYLIILDFENWDESSEIQKEILIYHELCHTCNKESADGEQRFDDEGRAVFGLIDHDVNEFIATVARYGSYNQEIKEFIDAASRKV